jgi:acetyl esterase/lipase
MDAAEKKNLNRMQLIRRVHGLVGTDDIEKNRHSQEQMGILLANNKDTEFHNVIVRPFSQAAFPKDLQLQEPLLEPNILQLNGEWISVTRPHMKKYVILYCHGGGYSTGSSLYARLITSKLAYITSMDVLAFDYRLAPENPYPAAVEDVIKAWDYLMLMGYGAKDIIVAGDSAGGNLALALTLKLKEGGRMLPRGLFLMSPWTDLTCTGASMTQKEEVDPVLTYDYIQKMILAYANQQDVNNPLISPLFGDFAGFPPVYIQVGENEILLSDSQRLYNRLQEAKVPVELDIFPGMWHVFQMTPFKTAFEAMDRGAEFIFKISR